MQDAYPRAAGLLDKSMENGGRRFTLYFDRMSHDRVNNFHKIHILMRSFKIEGKVI